MDRATTAAPATEAPPAFSGHETILRPNQSWLRLDGRQIWEYRDLLFLLVHREFASKYKQTVLGPIWFILQPLLTALVLTVFMGTVAHISTDGIPPVLFFLCNQLGWNYMQQNITVGGTTFTSNAYLFGKVYFPRLVMPLSTILSNFVACALQLALFLGMFFWFKFFVHGASGLHVTPAILFLPLLFIHLGALSLGVCLWLSSLTARYRDLSQVLQLLIQFWMIASPVMYPLSDFPERYRWLVEINPLTAILEGFRIALLGVGTITPASLTASIGATLLILFTGILFFQRTERTFIDTV